MAKTSLWAVNRILLCVISDLTPLERLVLIYIAEYADNTTLQCFPSQSTIGRRLGSDRFVVNKATKKLMKLGYIEKLHKTGKNNTYKLTMKGETNEPSSRKNSKSDSGEKSKDTNRDSRKRSSLSNGNSSIGKEGFF